MMRRRVLTSAKERLADTRGFMLGEQLVSILLIGLLCIAITAGLGAALSAYASVTKQARVDQMLVQSVEAVNDELAYALSVEGEDEAFPYFDSYSQRKVGVLQTDERGIWLNCGGDAQFVIAAADQGMKPVLENLVYSKGEWTYTIKIVPTDGSQGAYVEQDMKVKRIGS